ncbi:hypothetical protein [Comamonas brasiliensis]|uniref:hypothetical protein n=1 Tax=Comamonas brasiliensis TaxID=1812482 RepID=UPI001B8D5499|nr:hypothetical protein [Comamonas sp. PE63]
MKVIIQIFRAIGFMAVLVAIAALLLVIASKLTTVIDGEKRVVPVTEGVLPAPTHERLDPESSSDE